MLMPYPMPENHEQKGLKRAQMTVSFLWALGMIFSFFFLINFFLDFNNDTPMPAQPWRKGLKQWWKWVVMTNTGAFGVGWVIGTCFLFFFFFGSNKQFWNLFRLYWCFIWTGRVGLGVDHPFFTQSPLPSFHNHHPFFTSASVYATTICLFTTTAHLSTTATPFNYHHLFGH